MDKKQALAIILDRETSGLAYRSLAEKYGTNFMAVYRIINSKEKGEVKPTETAVSPAAGEAMPEDVKVLQEELRKARLKIALQDLVIDISSKELGIDLRKKRGTRQS